MKKIGISTGDTEISLLMLKKYFTCSLHLPTNNYYFSMKRNFISPHGRILRFVGKAIPIKCFVSHHLTDPFFFSKSKKKNSDSTVKEGKYLNLQAHDPML